MFNFSLAVLKSLFSFIHLAFQTEMLRKLHVGEKRVLLFNIVLFFVLQNVNHIFASTSSLYPIATLDLSPLYSVF